jgi:hypothetical protein
VNRFVSDSFRSWHGKCQMWSPKVGMTLPVAFFGGALLLMSRCIVPSPCRKGVVCQAYLVMVCRPRCHVQQQAASTRPHLFCLWARCNLSDPPFWCKVTLSYKRRGCYPTAGPKFCPSGPRIEYVLFFCTDPGLLQALSFFFFWSRVLHTRLSKIHDETPVLSVF